MHNYVVDLGCTPCKDTLIVISSSGSRNPTVHNLEWFQPSMPFFSGVYPCAAH